MLQEVVNARLRPNKATSNAYTHYKIHLSLILGAYTSVIPFPNHNQVRHAFDISLVKYVYILIQSHQFFFFFVMGFAFSPPCNVFQAAMSKQTIGIYATNY